MAGLVVFLITGTRLSWAASDAGLVPTLLVFKLRPDPGGGQDINFGSHAAPRFVEWNGD